MHFDYTSLDPGMAGAVITQVPTLVWRAPSAWTLIMQVSILVWRASTNFMKAYCLQGSWMFYKALIRLSGPYKGSIRFSETFCTCMTPPRPFLSSLPCSISVGQPCFSCSLFPLFGFRCNSHNFLVSRKLVWRAL